jgi:putative ABC transport system ATP-binding protein
MEPIIEAKNLDFVYNKGKDNEYHALINISLDIYPEEFVIVFGPSGCGKSTLLNVFAGLEMPDSGNIFVFNKDLTKMSKKDFAVYHRSEVGMIYQQYNLITSLSVLDNVALPQMFVDVRKGRRNRWSKKLLERFGILQQAKKIPTELSGGQQQRIGIARAIVNNPKIVLADEPVGNLDSVSAENVLSILRELNDVEKKTVIMVTHNPENLYFGDRIIYMKDGIITKEIVNKDKRKKKKTKTTEVKSPTTEITDLMRAYHGLSPEQINILILPYKAKVFAHHFITSRNMEETKIFEEVIQRRLLGTISQDELYDILNRSAMDGGVGFDKRTAEKILRRVNRVIRMAYFVYQEDRQRKNVEGEHEKISEEEKAEKVTDYLLKTCYNEFYDHLDDHQMELLKTSVSDRLEGDIQKSNFFKLLDRPIKEDGVGLNYKTAKAITEELELILILGFGIVKMDEQKDKNNLEKKEELAGEAARVISEGISEEDVLKPKEKVITEEKNEKEIKKAKLKKSFSLQDAMLEQQEREERLKEK